MSKSIMHDKSDGTCYLCMLLRQDFDRRTYLEEHHAMNGNPNRMWSEKYGLKVYLCIRHHREGPEAVHNNAAVKRLLQKKAQEAFEREYPGLSFRDIFGRDCLKDADSRQDGKEAAGQQDGEEITGQQASADGGGFRFIPDGIDGMDWERPTI